MTTDEQTLIDFRHSRWGHAVHPRTFKEVEPEDRDIKIQDERDDAYRISFLCHSSRRPKPGDVIAWKASEHDVFATCYECLPFRDPDDMYEVKVRITPEDRRPRP